MKLIPPFQRSGTIRAVATGALVVALALAMGAIAAAAFGNGSFFSAGDSGLNDRAASAAVVEGSASATHGDVTLSVRAVLADAIQTAVEVEFDGFPDGWAGVPTGARPYLEDATGAQFPLQRGGTSRDNIHASTLVFEQLTGASGPIELVIPSFGAKDLAGSGAPAPFLYAGEWRVAVPFERLDPASNRLAEVVNRDFGPGTIVVESVVVAPSGILVEGRLKGFTREDVIASVLVPARLTNDAGESAAHVGGYQGRGEDQLDFGLQFPPLEGNAFEIEISLNPAGNGSIAPSRLEPYFGAKIVVPIELE